MCLFFSVNRENNLKQENKNEILQSNQPLIIKAIIKVDLFVIVEMRLRPRL